MLMIKDLIVNSFFYFTFLCISLFGVKFLQTYYSFENVFYSIFISNVFYPINLPFYIYKKIKRKIKFDKENLKYYLFCGIIYNIECVLLWFVLNDIPLNIYVIGRSSYCIFNILFYKFYIYKEINKYYYIGSSFLIFSYLFLFLEYKDSSWSVITCISTGIITSTYNSIIEKRLTSLDKFYQLEFQNFFLGIGFLFIMPFVIPQITFINTPLFYFISFLIGISTQLYFLNKIIILSNEIVSGNIVISVLDLFRRITLCTLGFLLLHEKATPLIITSNLFMFLSFIFFIISTYKMSNLNKEFIKIQDIELHTTT